MSLTLRKNPAKNRITIAAMALSILVLANLAVSAQTPNCPLVISSSSGDLGAFTVTNPDTATISISIISGGVWGTLVVGSSVNANVNVGAIPLGTRNAVLITASKIDPNQAAGFALVATDTFGHSITINAIADCPIAPRGCTLTQGFWKNKPEEWPVQSFTLGTVTYTKTQGILILKTPVRGNGLVSLSHQLIAAKLNAASGATVPASVTTAISAADSLIGGLLVPPIGGGSLPTSSTSSLTSVLDVYNNGNTPGGPPHCDD